MVYKNQIKTNAIMKKLQIFGANLVFALLLFQLSACRTDQLPEAVEPEFCDTIGATYNEEVKAIIDAKCASSGCHDGTQPPRLDTYFDVNNQTDRIDVRALTQQTMPPASRPQLTNEELDILNCWKNASYPQQ
jgi:uncharacterized membrane protein